MEEINRIQKCFCGFVEGGLKAHDIDRVLDLLTEDVIGSGMGSQAIIGCREDMRLFLLRARRNMSGMQTKIRYENMQTRYYGDDYANICATVVVTTMAGEQSRKSRIGQCASMRKIEEEWKINMLQAAPLSLNVQEIEAYPFSFAEDEIEKYRRQEKFSDFMRKDLIATYKIDLETGKFEDYVPTERRSISVKSGDDYESEIFGVINRIVDEETRIKFIKTFSVANLIKSYRLGQTEINLDYESVRPDGESLWLRNSVHLFQDMGGHVKSYLHLFDIDRQKRREIRLIQKAELDLATCIYNKETTRKKIESAVQLYSIPRTGAFFMIDLDFFKQINDTYGHAKGDYVIQQIANILKEYFRSEDIIGRLGGDEFCVFYTGKNNYEVIARKAEQICEAARNIYSAKGRALKTSISVGIARRVGNENFDELYRKADQALFVRKAKKGRDGFTIYAHDSNS